MLLWGKKKKKKPKLPFHRWLAVGAGHKIKIKINNLLINNIKRNRLFRGLAHCKYIHCPIKTSFPSRNNDLSPHGTLSCAEFTSPSLQHHRKMRELINLAVKPGDMHRWCDKTGLGDSALISRLQAAVSILGQLYTSTTCNKALSFSRTVPASLTVIYWIYNISVITSSLTRDNSRASIWPVFCHLFTGMLPKVTYPLS